MKAPVELETMELLPIFLGAGNVSGDDAGPAYRIRREIKKVPGFVCEGGGCTLTPDAQQFSNIQVKPADQEKMYRWAKAFIMTSPTPTKMDMLESIAGKLGQEEDFQKVLEDFIDEEGDETEG